MGGGCKVKGFQLDSRDRFPGESISKLEAVGQMTFEIRDMGKVFRQIDHHGQDLEVGKRAGLVHENESSYILCFCEINIAAVC